MISVCKLEHFQVAVPRCDDRAFYTEALRDEWHEWDCEVPVPEGEQHDSTSRRHQADQEVDVCTWVSTASLRSERLSYQAGNLLLQEED